MPALRLEIDRYKQVVMKIWNLMRDGAPCMADRFELTRDEGHEALLPEVLLGETVLSRVDTRDIPSRLSISRLTLRDGIRISSWVAGLIHCQCQCSRSGCRTALYPAIWGCATIRSLGDLAVFAP